MVLFENEAAILEATQNTSGAWLSSFDRHHPSLDIQLQAYLQELRCGHSWCYACRQPRQVPEQDMPECESVNASFGFILNLPTRCAAHRMPDMERVTDICPHGHRAIYCFDCGGHHVCNYHSVSGCATLGSAKYDGYCVRCYVHLFPDQPITRQFRIKERHVYDAVVARFPDRGWVLNRTIHGGCSQRRPDIFLDAGTFVVIVEVDEEQHRGYSCENRRIMELFRDGGCRPVAFVRFNPDGYVDATGRSVSSCFGLDAKGFARVKPSKTGEWHARLEALFGRLSDLLEQPKLDKEVTVVQLFYDG